MKILALGYLFFRKSYKRVVMYLLRSAFKRCGTNFHFDPYGTYTYNTIEIGNDVYIGPGATITSSESSIIFGNKILLGPNVTIIGGDHNTSVIGKFMYDVKEKLPENDLPIIIEDDVWIGTGAIILKGVTIGTGSIVAAGAIVTKNVPSYCIVGGVPAKVIKERFSQEEKHEHLRLIQKVELLQSK